MEECQKFDDKGDGGGNCDIFGDVYIAIVVVAVQDALLLVRGWVDTQQAGGEYGGENRTTETPTQLKNRSQGWVERGVVVVVVVVVSDVGRDWAVHKGGSMASKHGAT